MAKHNFQGDITGISDRQLEFINDVILQQGFKVNKVTFELLGNGGDNYLSIAKRIRIEGEKTLFMIAKIAPTYHLDRGRMNAFVAFRNEHIIYTVFFPKILKLQENASIPENERFKFAKCFGSLTEQPNEVIILEDLNQLGYIMEDRYAPLSESCVKNVLKNVAVFHSLSYILKRDDPKSYDYLKDNLIDYWAKSEDIPDLKLFFNHITEDTLSVLKEQTHIDAIKDKINNIHPLMKQYWTLEYNSKYSIIQQGDCWTNNIMFRYPNNNTVDSILIDYQMSKNSNPVYDIMFMIFNCTDHASRSGHFYEWIDHYYEELDKFLSLFGMKANFVYPREQLDADMKRYGKLILGVSLVLLNVILRKADDAASIKKRLTDTLNAQNVFEEMSLSNKDEDLVNLFRNRVIDLIDSFHLFDLL